MTVYYGDPSDIAIRLGRNFTEAELAQAGVFLGDASALLRAAFPGLDDMIANGSVDEAAVIAVAASMVKRAMISPSDGVASESETTGPFSRSTTYANPLGNVFLTAAERLLIVGYTPAGGSFSFQNTTTHVEHDMLGYSYDGFGGH